MERRRRFRRARRKVEFTRDNLARFGAFILIFPVIALSTKPAGRVAFFDMIGGLLQAGILTAIAVGGLSIAWRIYRWYARDRWLRSVELAKVDVMTGIEFERFIAHLFRRQQFDVRETKATGDQGADLILKKTGRCIVVQTKRSASPIGNSAVQEVVAAKAMYGADDAFVVTNHSYTRAARELAGANAVVLMDREDVAKMLRDSRSAT